MTRIILLILFDLKTCPQFHFRIYEIPFNFRRLNSVILKTNYYQRKKADIIEDLNTISTK